MKEYKQLFETNQAVAEIMEGKNILESGEVTYLTRLRAQLDRVSAALEIAWKLTPPASVAEYKKRIGDISNSIDEMIREVATEVEHPPMEGAEIKEDVTADMNKIKDSIDFDGKPETFKGIFNSVSKGAIPYSKLPKFKIEDVFKDGANASPTSSFKKRVPQYFILHTPHGEFLVDTQGYDYARYVIRVK